MAGRRTVWVTLVAAALTGCATTERVERAAVTPSIGGPVVERVTGTAFAELPHAPGDRVLRHPELVEVPTVTPTPPKAVETKPPAVFVATPVDPPLVAAVRATLASKPAQAADALRGLEPPNAGLMQELLPPVVELSRADLGRAGPVELGVLTDRVEQALAPLAARGVMTIPKAVFCESLRGYGQYRPLPPGYAYGPGDVAEVYVEVRNVPSVRVEASDGGYYLTHLRSTLRVRDKATGLAVELTDAEGRPVPALRVEQRDESRSPVRDYFKGFRVPVPQRPGRYVLTVEFLDPDTQRSVSQALTFDVRGS